MLAQALQATGGGGRWSRVPALATGVRDDAACEDNEEVRAQASFGALAQSKPTFAKASGESSSKGGSTEGPCQINPVLSRCETCAGMPMSIATSLASMDRISMRLGRSGGLNVPARAPCCKESSDRSICGLLS